MRLLTVIIFILAESTGYAQKELLQEKTWVYKALAIINQQDTLVLFHADSAKNIWYLGRVSLTLKANNTYSGTDINGNSQIGTWSMPIGQKIIVDKDTNQLISSSNRQFTTITPINYRDSSIDISGTLLTVFYSVSDPTSTCASLQSGAWSASSTWSCGHEPSSTDVVILKHIVAIPADYTAHALTLTYDSNGRLSFGQNGKLQVGSK